MRFKIVELFCLYIQFTRHFLLLSSTLSYVKIFSFLAPEAGWLLFLFRAVPPFTLYSFALRFYALSSFSPYSFSFSPTVALSQYFMQTSKGPGITRAFWRRKSCSHFWLGQLDSNQRSDGVKVRCLTAWRWPNIGRRQTLANLPSLLMGWEMGLEPTIFGTTIRRVNQLRYTHHKWHATQDSNLWPTA